MERGSIYPSWRYHVDGRSVLCLDAAQDAELGDVWSDKDVRWSVPVESVAEEEPAPEKKKPGRPRKDAN